MNAKFLERLIKFRKNRQLEASATILSQKILFQFATIKNLKSAKKFTDKIYEAKSVEEILLIEARAAKNYWMIFGQMINRKVCWSGRSAHGDGVANKLLDIGYHFLTNKILDIFEKVNIPAELGLFHKAQSSRAKPLAYDFMEWLRPVVIDLTLLKILNKKKKFVTVMPDDMVPIFVNEIKKKLATHYFNNNLGYCITLEYWIELVLLEFLSAVNSNRKFRPHFPSLRHENRCLRKIKPPNFR